MNKEDPDSLSDLNSVLKQICAWTRSSHVWPEIVQKGATVLIRGDGWPDGMSGNSYNNCFWTKNPHQILYFSDIFDMYAT